MCIEYSYIVGVDGGGSRCRVSISKSDGTLAGTADSGAANFTTNPIQTIENVRDAVSSAALAASLSSDDLHSCVAHIGLAGVLNELDASNVASSLPFTHVAVSDDRLTSALGALGKDDGALAAVGTGSFVAVCRDSEIQYFGGWGFQVSDQASGAWLGRSALEQCILACDGLLDHSDLTQILLRHVGRSLLDIVSFAKHAPTNEYAALAPLVVDAARAGDPVGRNIMQLGGDYLNTCLEAANIKERDVVCLTGGVGPHYEPYLKSTFRDRIRAPKGTALDGALHLALKALNSLEAAK